MQMRTACAAGWVVTLVIMIIMGGCNPPGLHPITAGPPGRGAIALPAALGKSPRLSRLELRWPPWRSGTFLAISSVHES